jgi:adenylate cyclase class 2
MAGILAEKVRDNNNSLTARAPCITIKVMNKRNLEVEFKARVKDPARVRRVLARLGTPMAAIDYHDIYFCPAAVRGYTFKRFRLRRLKGKALVTAKERMRGHGVEASREHEFEVSDPDAFQGFTRTIGYQEFIRKTKKGKRWRVKSETAKGMDASVDLIEVAGLGHFLEIEIMVASPAKIPAASKRIKQIFSLAGVSEDDIETKPYTLMLYELKLKKRRKK